MCIFKLAKNTSVRVDFYAIVVQNNDQPMTNSVFALHNPFVTSTTSTSTNFNLVQARDQEQGASETLKPKPGKPPSVQQGCRLRTAARLKIDAEDGGMRSRETRGVIVSDDGSVQPRRSWVDDGNGRPRGNGAGVNGGEGNGSWAMIGCKGVKWA